MTDHQDEPDTLRGLLAFEIERLRKQSGRSLAQLAEETSYDRTYLNRLETGERISQRPVMTALDEVYGTGGYLGRLWKLARQEGVADRYKLFMQYEARAVLMRKYMVAIPGLLQTEDYARVVLSAAPALDGTDVEEQVAARIRRQEILRRDPPPHLRIILDEAALRRPTADANIWYHQLAHLVESASSPCMVTQVLPFANHVHSLMGGSLSLLWMPDGEALAYLEGSRSGELIEDPSEITQLRLHYDRVRDSALSPSDSRAFIQQFLEDSKP